MSDYWQEIRDNWDDPYWRASHPEVMAVLVGVLSGIIGLTFVGLELWMRNHAQPS